MSDESRNAVTVLALVGLMFGGYAVTANLPRLYHNFLFADQAVYFSMTQSIAYDGDLEWTKKDLIRYKDAVGVPPIGIFLKKAPDGRLFFAKPFVYSLFAAPFVRVFGINGHAIFHALLLLLVLLAGYAWFALSNRPLAAAAAVATFLFASVGWVYFFWISNDFFHFALPFLILFLAFYKTRRAEATMASAAAVARESRERAAEASVATAAPAVAIEPAARPGTAEPAATPETVAEDATVLPRRADPAPANEIERGSLPGRFRRFLLSDRSDYAAALLAGIATFSKPPNAALMLPLLFVPLLRKSWKKTALIAGFFLAGALLLFGANYLLTSDWNAMGGERKTFIDSFPLEKGVTFDAAGGAMTSEGYFQRMLLPPRYIPVNLFYYVFGRFTGLAWYYFPALLLTGVFIFTTRRKGRWRWLVFGAAAAEVLFYVTIMPTNPAGGGGSLANRYFMPIFPLFFFLPALRLRRWQPVLAWAWAAVWISPILLQPLSSSAGPAMHAKRYPIKALPIEMTQVNEWPTNTSPTAFRVPAGTEPNTGFLNFLDDNFNVKTEPNGVWTAGARPAEMVLKTYYPLSRIVVRLTNNPRRDNRVRVTVDGETKEIVMQPRTRTTLEFAVGTGFTVENWFRKPGGGISYLHRLVVGAAKGSIPYLEDDNSKEERDLGVFFELELVPRPER